MRWCEDVDVGECVFGVGVLRGEDVRRIRGVVYGNDEEFVVNYGKVCEECGCV